MAQPQVQLFKIRKFREIETFRLGSKTVDSHRSVDPTSSIHQLNKTWNNETVDLIHVSERSAYFSVIS
jgi:hypothetical protein